MVSCASVEYVISPDNEIKDIRVVSSTSKHFAKQAKLNVKKWKWSVLPKGILQDPIKTNTQFQFCLETGVDIARKTIILKTISEL